MKKWIFYILLVVNLPIGMTETDPTDSLIHLYRIAENKTEKSETLIKICLLNREKDPETMGYFAKKLIGLAANDTASISFARGNYFIAEYYFSNNSYREAESYYLNAFQGFHEIGNDEGVAEAATSLANIYFYRDRYRTALNFAKIALDKYYNTANQIQQANASALICDIYTYIGNYNQAIQYCVQALRIKEKLDIKKGTEITLNTMGTIYQGLGTSQKAREYLFKALSIAKKNNDPNNIATTYSNIGNYYLSFNQNDSALQHFKKALKIDSISKDSSGLAYSYFDIAKVYRQKNEIVQAKATLKLAQELATNKVMPELIARISLELGDIYIDEEEFGKAITELKNSLAIAQRINSKGVLKDCYQKLAKYYDKVNDKDNALVYMRLYMLESEKRYREENIKSIAEIETLYNIDKKEKEISLLKKENDIKQLQAEKRKFLLVALSIGLFLLFILIIILYSRNKLKSRANKALQIQNIAIEKQKAEIESQKEELGKKSDVLEDKNKQIIDSIIYARQIQESLLPSTKLLKNKLPKSFVYYKPKDIVSGDFYWNAKIDNKITVAVVDCTGHGVPGAFMTVLANSLLNQIILETGISSPDLVVSLLDQKIQQSLHQQQLGSSSTDGLDIGLVFIDLKKHTIEFTGAKIPLYIINNGHINKLKPDRYSVGSTQQNNKTFTKTQIKIDKGSMIYMSSDGYQDQFGGPHGKKFMKPNFYRFLQSIHELAPEEQENKLERQFQQWKGTNPQTDDVLVLGIRL